uniref:Capsid protein n=1 Tax=viral metagenome TaxID=1070528 RepID=A0A2V0RJ57_9ZZZZ
MNSNNPSDYSKAAFIAGGMPSGRISKPPFQTPGAEGSAPSTPVGKAPPGASTGNESKFSKAARLGRKNPMTSPKAKGQSTKAQTKTKTQTQKQKENNMPNTGTQKADKGPKNMNPFRPPFPKLPTDDDEPRMRLSIPQGLEDYRDGTTISFNTDNFPGLAPEPEKFQRNGSWTNTNDATQVVSNVRTHYQVIDCDYLPQGFYGLDGNTGGWDTTQGDIHNEATSRQYNAYVRRRNSNIELKNSVTNKNTFIYHGTNLKLVAEVICLMNRQAYYKAASNIDNPALNRIAQVLNKSALWKVRNDAVNALESSFVPKYAVDQYNWLLGNYQMTPFDTGGTQFFVTPMMSELLIDLGLAADETEIQTALDNYTDKFRVKIAAITADVYSTVPARINGTELVDLGNSSTLLFYQSTRRFLNGFYSELAKYESGWMQMNDWRRPASTYGYDAGFNDIYNNWSFRRWSSATNITILPPQISGTTDTVVNYTLSPNDNAVTYYGSSQSENQQQFHVIESMADRFVGCSPLFYSMDTTWSTSSGDSRQYLVYGSYDGTIDASDQLPYESRTNIIVPGNNTYPFVQDNYVSKVLSSSTTGLQTVTQVDGLGQSLWYLPLGKILSEQKIMARKVLP